MQSIYQQKFPCLFYLNILKDTFALCMQSKRIAVMRIIPSKRKECR